MISIFSSNFQQEIEWAFFSKSRNSFSGSTLVVAHRCTSLEKWSLFWAAQMKGVTVNKGLYNRDTHMHLIFKKGQNNSKIKVINALLFWIFCPVVTVNFAEWQKQRETVKFAKSLSEIIVTQKSFEQKRGQWESERETQRLRETVDHSKITIMPMLEDYTLQRGGNRRIARGQWESSSA